MGSSPRLHGDGFFAKPLPASKSKAIKEKKKL
jgi:hypothetical protein